MNQKRILQVVGKMNRGGAETMLMSMYRALDRERLQFDFLEFGTGPSDYSEEINELGGRIIQIQWSQSPAKLWRTIRNLANILEKEGPYIAVHSHVLFASGTVLLAAAKAGVKVRIAHSHSTDSQEKKFHEKLYRILARAVILAFATDIVACTNDAGGYMFGKRRFIRTGRVIPNAVDVQQFRLGTAEERTKLRAEFGLSSESLALVAVARMEPVKNHNFLIDVAGKLRDQGRDFDMFFVGDGSLRSSLEEQVLKRGLEQHIHFLGLRKDVPEILRCVDALLMPSYFEGLPVSLVEAQATGLPCIASTNVSTEADMGLGLMKYLPLNSPSKWVDELSQSLPKPPIQEEIHAQLKRRGYIVEGSLQQLLSLYASSFEGA